MLWAIAMAATVAHNHTCTHFDTDDTQHTGELSGDDSRLEHVMSPSEMLRDGLFHEYRNPPLYGTEQGPPVDGDARVPGLADTLLYGPQGAGDETQPVQ